MARTYDDWKTTDPRDMEPPEKPERDPDDAYDEWRDEQLCRETMSGTLSEMEAANRKRAMQDAYDAGKYEYLANHYKTEFERLEKRYTSLQPILEVLGDVQEYLDNRADVDDGIPNEAMRLLVEVRAAIRKAEGR